MDENDKGPGQDDLKPFDERGETSGVFSLRRVQEAVEDKRAEVEKMVADALVRQALFRQRAEVRNNFRSWTERVPFLAQTFHEDFIPPMTAQQVANEERQRVERKAQRIARKNKNDVYMQAVHNYIQTAESPYRDATQVELEEKAKYMAGKVRLLFSRGDFAGAVHFFRAHVGDFPHPHEAEVFRDQMYEECCILLTSIYNKAEFEVLPEALDAIAQMTKLEREDFPFLGVNEQNNAVKKVFEDRLCVAMGQHPAIYLRMRQTFLDLGFIDAVEVDENPHIRAAMMDLLIGALRKHPKLYYSFLRQLHDAGVVNGEVIHTGAEIQTAIRSALEEAMRVGPISYILLREYMTKSLLIDGTVYNQDEKIQEASVQHFDDWHSDETGSYEGFVLFMRRHGLSVPAAFEKQMKEEKPWHKRLFSKLKDMFRQVDAEYFEKMMDESRMYDESFLQEERHAIAELLRAFSEKYPMFRRGK